MADESGSSIGHGQVSIQAQTQAPLANDLAVARTILALDRTLLSWFRTSLSLIGFGFALIKFMALMLSDNKIALVNTPFLSPRAMGFTMMILGLGCLIGGIIDHRLSIKKMRKLNLVISYWSTSTFMASLLAAFALILILSLGLEIAIAHN